MTEQKNVHSEITLRPPVVTIMGHVDHGKTSLLDYIRKSSIASKEAGGITQSIGAYQATFKNKKITFIDTPGHAAFSQMRTRGGKAADIVILVVSAEDGVMPQTKEVISIIKLLQLPVIVAINKVDLPTANVQRVKQQLAEYEILVEDWGGDILCVEVSAKTGMGIDNLLESILTLSEMQELQASKSADFEGFIIESKLDAKRGPIFSGIVKNGTLKVGSEIYASGVSGKVKALINYLGENVKEAYPSDPIEVLGFSAVPKVGDVFVDSRNKELIKALETDEELILGAEGATKCVNIILKADTQGSLEALEAAIRNVEFKDFKVRVLKRSTGDIAESDVLFAKTSGALVFGFNCRVPSKVEDIARGSQVLIKTYKIIYELLEEVGEVLKEAAHKEEIKVKGRAEVLKIFKLTSGDIVVGCRVLAGALKDTSRVSVFRDNGDVPLYTGKVKNLKKGKDDVSVVGKDNECGVMLRPQFEDIKPGDTIEVL